VVALVRVPSPDAGEIDHDTPLPDRSLFTVALMGRESPACTAPVAGDAETVSAGTVMVAEFDFEVSAAAVPVMVNVRSLAGGMVGAV
jgi:hypothetical protein